MFDWFLRKKIEEGWENDDTFTKRDFKNRISEKMMRVRISSRLPKFLCGSY